MSRRILEFIFISLIVLTTNPACAKDKNFEAKFLALQPIIGDSDKINLKILDESLTQNSLSIKITTRLDVSASVEKYPAFYTINLYKKLGDQKEYLSRVNLSVLNKKQAKSSLVNFSFNYYPTIISEDFYIDVYDANQDLIATYIQNINFSNDLIGSGPGTDGLTSYGCEDTDGKCLLDYIVDNIKFYSSLEPSVQTQIIKEDDQPYKIFTPILRKKRLRVAKQGGSDLINFKSNFFDELFIGDDNSRFRLSSDDEKLYFGFNNTNSLSLSSEGKIDNLILKETDTTNLPEIPGKLEYDGDFLYFTDNDSRKRVFLGTPSSGGIGNNPNLTGTVTVANDIIVNESLVFDAITTNSSAASVNINWHNGNRQSLTLNQATTLSFTAPPGVAHLTLMLTQDATGGRTVTWPASTRWPNNTAPTLTTAANQIDIITCFYTGTLYYCQAGLNFSP